MRLAAGILVVSVLACGGQTSSSLLTAPADSGAPGVAQACANQAAADCALRDSCTGGVANEITYGGAAACVSALTASCIANLGAPDTANTAAHVEGCAQAYPTESCTDWWANNTVAACRSPAGARTNGAVCGVNAQCASAFCFIGANSGCGTCHAPAMPGDPCQVSSQCQYSMDCPVVAPATSGVCTVRGGLGAACDDRLPCDGGLACIGSNSATMVMGTCLAGQTTTGVTCNSQSGPGCDGELYLHCTSGTCQAEPLVADGQPCGDVGPAYVPCDAGGLCVKPAGSQTGTCVGAAPVGAACDSVLGPPCLSPAKCISASGTGTSGTCRSPDPASCG